MPDVYFINNTLKINVIFLLSGIIPLIFSYLLKHLFNMLPCKLCIYEQIVYCVIILFSLAQTIKNNKVFVYSIFCSYIIGIILSLYHIGLEFHLFYDILGCSEEMNSSNLEDIKSNLLKKTGDSVRFCDRPHYILGISLSTWNFFYLLVVFFISNKIYFEKRKENIIK